MKPFHTIAIPHSDILEGNLSLDIFAADLWDTFLGRAPLEYTDSEIFFKKTYPTQGLKNLLKTIEERLIYGKGGSPVIHIQTPFGGGKTHTLIAMYHKAIEWKAKTVVIVGTTLSGNDTIWGIIEKQLTGKIDKLLGNLAPGREALREIISINQPVLILIDELLEYVVKAGGIKINDTTLASQTLAFIQELTELTSTLDKTSVVITLPSSTLEHYDSNAEKLYQQLQKIAGRVERIYTPVQDKEITSVIRKRLFSTIDEKKSLEVILEFLEYAEKEEILPAGMDSSEYFDRFENSYPFLPEVIDTLYHKWGSFPTFQRTRGVLRLLSLVVNTLSEKMISYISLSNFDLEHNEIRHELIKHIGSEFDSVISSDITSSNSGAKKVDKSLGKSYQGIRLGTRTATTVFMNSFSGGHIKGSNINEIKRLATTTENPSSVIVEGIDQLKDKLFFLQNSNDNFFFSNQPNLNRIILTKIENIKDIDLLEIEKDLITKHIQESKKLLKVYLWPEKPRDIGDTEELKIVLLPKKEENIMKLILESKGESPRVYRNTIAFVCPYENQRIPFIDSLKRSIAFSQIQNDKTLNLNEEQQREIEEEIKKEISKRNELLRKLYRIVCIPANEIKENSIVKEIDLGTPDISIRRSIIEDVYDQLRQDGEILERISPLVLKERYLKDNEFIKIKQIYDSMMKTPGEIRYISRNVITNSIREGVKQGIFGLGEISLDSQGNENPICNIFQEDVYSIEEENILTIATLCKKTFSDDKIEDTKITTHGHIEKDSDSKQPTIMNELELSFEVPRGKISHIMGIMNLLQQKFEFIHIDLKAQKGSLSQEDYENKIKEALQQLGIEIH